MSDALAWRTTAGLAVSERPGAGDGPWSDLIVVLVHGALDRGSSFGRVARHLADLHVVTYDRRGYADSLGTGPASDVAQQAEDLAEVVHGRRGVVIGHSLGGVVALAFAERATTPPGAVVVYEPPLSWLPWWPTDTAGAMAAKGGDDPAGAAERFLRRLIGDERWERLPAESRRRRRAEGPALLAELASLRSAPAFDAACVGVPVLVGCGGASADHHRRACAHLAESLPQAVLVELAGAGHGAHLSHPARFAELVRRGVAAAAGHSVASMPDVQLSSSGPPETVLDPEAPEATAALVEALAGPEEQRRDRVAAVVARWPADLDAWAHLGDHARDLVEAYAAYRVGYHRGLDRLRASGWRGSGYVRWAHPTNRGFLRCLDGLRSVAAALGEADEARRCETFLAQLDPGSVRGNS